MPAYAFPFHNKRVVMRYRLPTIIIMYGHDATNTENGEASKNIHAVMQFFFCDAANDHIVDILYILSLVRDSNEL